MTCRPGSSELRLHACICETKQVLMPVQKCWQSMLSARPGFAVVAQRVDAMQGEIGG